MSTCHERKAGRKGSGSGAGSVQCHATEGVAEERRGGGSGSGRQAGVGSIRGSPYRSRWETGKGSEGVREVRKRSGRPWESVEEVGRHGK